MTNPIVIWFANLIGWGVGPTVALVTALVLLGYVLGFLILLEVLVHMTLEFKRTDSGLTKLLLLVPIVLLGAIFLVLDFLHTLLCIWLGFSLMTGFRNWWHRAR
jgi:hypothetical protein